MKYGLTVNGKIRVFSKSKEFENKETKKKFTITDHWFNVSEKELDGTWFNKSMKMFFPRNTEKPDNNTVIIVKEGRFLITGKEKYRQIALFVKEWDFEGIDGTEVTEEDIPF